MSTPGGKSSYIARSNMPAFGAFGAQQPSASLIFDKSNPGIRRATPDSEALASSDDEIDITRNTVSSNPRTNKPTRRTSWLNDVSAVNLNRKPSVTGPYSPSVSNPGTPGADQPSWPNIGNNTTPGWNSGTTPNPWGSIWSQDARKEPPARLQEVMPQATESIPFSIPLQPTPKTYRSQSYSVGQLDTALVSQTSVTNTAAIDTTRPRLGHQYPSLQRRTSRPSGIGGLDSSLGKVREDEDEDERATFSHPTESYDPSQIQRAQRLEQENAQLRYALQTRDRTLPSKPAAQPRSTRVPSGVPEEYDNAVDDQEEMSGSGLLQRRANNVRRMSEQAGMPYDRQQQSPSQLDSSRKAHWQTSLGFGPIQEAPQSRRHSLADVPTRHGSLSSHGEGGVPTYANLPQESLAGEDRKFTLPAPADTQDHQCSAALRIVTTREFAPTAAAYQPERGTILTLRRCTPVLEANYPFDWQTPEPESILTPVDAQAILKEGYLRASASYFATSASTREAAETHVHSSFLANHPYSPHSHLGTYMGPASAPLHIVNFKCCRSDVFYVQDNTGLQVGVGDLVIVEADRGTDLGTVQHTNVTWDEARRYKEHYAEEHYKWLMMFSQQSRNGGPNVINPNGLPSRQGSAVGGMGPPGQHGAHEAPHTELKPKMIKRLAQAHEIKTLQDKEGNEAKAKRVCQQKVIEHRLNMEILDAEFQMDSKKLTFYYFADSYINFNPLVTDLFKIYKTRIWMSAINPASFQTPTASLGLQPAYGGMPHGRDSPAGRRRQQYGQQPGPPAFENQYENERTFADQQPPVRGPYMSQFGFPPGMNQVGPGMGPFAGMQEQHIDPMAQYYGQQSFQMLNPNAPNFASGRPSMRSNGPHQSPANDWTGRFQGLSLGS